MHRRTIVVLTGVFCIAVLIAREGEAVTANPFESLHAAALSADVGGRAHSHVDWESAAFNADALRRARAAVPANRSS